MTHLKLKLGFAGLILAGAVAYLGYTGIIKGSVFTLDVDQYVAKTQAHNQRIRLCGTVAAEGLEVHKAQRTARFFLKGQEKQIPVAYQGDVPDLFKAGSEIVIEGQQDEAGVFQADLLLTKCASKYEEMAKEKPASSPATGDHGAKP